MQLREDLVRDRDLEAIGKQVEWTGAGRLGGASNRHLSNTEDKQMEEKANWRPECSLVMPEGGAGECSRACSHCNCDGCFSIFLNSKCIYLFISSVYIYQYV